jgi:hypothetical protein
MADFLSFLVAQDGYVDAGPVENATLQQLGKGFGLIGLLVAAARQRRCRESDKRDQSQTIAHPTALQHVPIAA